LAKEGKLRCPLILRPTSEDIVTAHILTIFQTVNPRWWLPHFRNRSLGTDRFRTQVYRRLQIEGWQKQPRFPRHLIHWDGRPPEPLSAYCQQFGGPEAAGIESAGPIS